MNVRIAKRNADESPARCVPCTLPPIAEIWLRDVRRGRTLVRDGAVGAVAGLFSLFVGVIFLFGLDGALPDLGTILPF